MTTLVTVLHIVHQFVIIITRLNNSSLKDSYIKRSKEKLNYGLGIRLSSKMKADLMMSQKRSSVTSAVTVRSIFVHDEFPKIYIRMCNDEQAKDHLPIGWVDR